MNSSSGKEILSLVRGADFAHAGGEEAIEEVFSDIAPDPSRKLLDVGCGRGGTAAYLTRKGYGTIAGFDLDCQSIEYASMQYREVSFICCKAESCGDMYAETFNLAYSFNVFHCLDYQQQAEAFRQLASLVDESGMLIIFDYTSESVCEPNFCPIRDSRMRQDISYLGWHLTEYVDYTDRYRLWYSLLLRQLAVQQDVIISRFGRERLDAVYGTYRRLLDRLESGVVGGATYYLTRRPASTT